MNKRIGKKSFSPSQQEGSSPSWQGKCIASPQLRNQDDAGTFAKSKYSSGLLEKTIKVWQPYSQTPLSLDDAREIVENITGFFRTLSELDKKHNQNGKEI